MPRSHSHRSDHSDHVVGPVAVASSVHGRQELHSRQKALQGLEAMEVAKQLLCAASFVRCDPEGTAKLLAWQGLEGVKMDWEKRWKSLRTSIIRSVSLRKADLDYLNRCG